MVHDHINKINSFFDKI